MATQSILEAARQHLASASEIASALGRSASGAKGNELSERLEKLSSHLEAVASEIARAESFISEQSSRINQLSGVVLSSTSRIA